MSILNQDFYGNGKRDHTPTPSRLRKIKRISFKALLYLKGLLKDFRREAEKSEKAPDFSSHRAPRLNDLEARIYLTPSQKNGNGIHYDYEPSRIQNTRRSLFWQWRRVAEWHRYINDPIENKSGHIIT